MSVKSWNILSEAYTGFSLNEMINLYYRKLENKLFLYNNCDLIWRCAERADLIYEYQFMNDFIEMEDFLEYELNLDSYISNLPSKSELENRELGFL